MKLLRLSFLLLLVVLLPIRGAMALGVPCALVDAPTVVHAGMADMADMAADSDAPHEHAMPGSMQDRHGDADGGSDGCTTCAALCCPITPSALDLAVVLPRLEPAAVIFPSIAVPATNFLSDGQERPPRRI